ncbi:MAG: RNA polymerase sigma-54 factor [Syntrophus sp. PtaU1.Bin005]|uniref:RNA polymerase factor sigma-54 n=1 Tax=Syntrophus sp. (in: bacteria) TaxID=48412 RepID=UPI0009C4F3EB|nr:MAG: RNA polymerase sigma-54 factor [Syntrophus sp. PtaU1.Bin005]
MAFELKQNLKLSQQLIMTPQLQQAIKLLQLSRMEMIDVINQEMEENPLLEDMPPEDYDEAELSTVSEEGTIAEVEDFKGIERTEEITGEGDGKEDFDWSSYLEDYGSVGASYDRRDGEAPSWDNLLTKKATLTDHLMWQLKLTRLSELEMRIGEQIVGNLDTNGYLAATTEEIARLEDVEETEVEAVLAKIQEYDPPGIAARNLQECLLIQVRLLGIENPLVDVIIQNHMKDLEIKNYNHIAKKNRVSIDEVLQAVMMISDMDPRPGSIYNEERIQAIIPDVYVFKAGDEYKIVLNDDGMPRLRISNFYKEIMGNVKNDSNSDNGKKYIRERVQSATWLIKSIQQRQRTIYKVAESIVRYQKDFFDRGINHLKPLVLRDIAYDVEMHESTISRVVTNKYMYTPRGIFELKYFFSSSIQKKSGEAIASKSVKEEIRKAIASENPKNPYSDHEIVSLLEGKGIKIARRTVAKYREMMNILPSSRRKRYF